MPTTQQKLKNFKRYGENFFRSFGRWISKKGERQYFQKQRGKEKEGNQDFQKYCRGDQSRRRFFLTSQKLKDVSNFFIYRKNKLVLNKISITKSKGVVEQILRKLGFKLSTVEAELNLPDTQKKDCISTKNSFTPIIHQGILQSHSQSVILLNNCHI